VGAASSTDALDGSAALTVLPLLEFALTELWHRRQDDRLTHQAYEQIGGVVGGLARWCDQAYHSLPAAQRPVVRRIVTSLVRPGDEAANIPPTRQRRNLDQLRAETAETSQDTDGEIDAVVAALADRRLLVTSRDPTSSEPVVELVHEALIREGGLLRQWLSEDHEFLLWREDLEADYTQWTTSSRDPELLLRGSALEQARTWLDARPGELPGELAEFIRLSDRSQHQRLTRDRRRVRLLAVLLAIAIGLGLFSGFQTNRARQQARLATSRSLAARAERLAGSQPDLAQLLSLASLHTAAIPEAWASVQTTLSRPLHPSHQLTGHTNLVWSVAFSPDGKLLATTSRDHTARLWDVTARQPLGEPLTGHTDTILGVAFSPDGKLLATTSRDHTARLWDVPSRQPVDEYLTGHTNTVNDVAFSPDGKLLATTSGDHTARLWATPVTWVGHSCELVGRSLSQQEWERYVGAGTSYVRQCAQYPSGPGADPDAPAAVYPASP
jgi:hypothetical protein